MRFFAPDEQTPGQRGEPWQLGDCLSWVHGPDIRNIYVVETVEVGPGGEHKRGELIRFPRERFAAEIDAFLARNSKQ